jgi:hypothetical protein
VQTCVLAPWHEDGQTWRRLHVTFPARLATHSAQQTFSYDQQGLLRRQDYAVDVVAKADIAHYVAEHRAFGGLVLPTRRRVYRCRLDNTAETDLAFITVDIRDVAVG